MLKLQSVGKQLCKLGGKQRAEVGASQPCIPFILWLLKDFGGMRVPCEPAQQKGKVQGAAVVVELDAAADEGTTPAMGKDKEVVSKQDEL